MRNDPVSSLVLLRTRPVETLVTVKLTPGNAAPCGSRTVPAISPCVVCAFRAPHAPSNTTNAASFRRTTFMDVTSHVSHRIRTPHPDSALKHPQKIRTHLTCLERILQTEQDSPRVVRLAGEHTEIRWAVQIQRRVIEIHQVEHVQKIGRDIHPLPFRYANAFLDRKICVPTRGRA